MPSLHTDVNACQLVHIIWCEAMTEEGCVSGQSPEADQLQGDHPALQETATGEDRHLPHRHHRSVRT